MIFLHGNYDAFSIVLAGDCKKNKAEMLQEVANDTTFSLPPGTSFKTAAPRFFSATALLASEAPSESISIERYF